MLVRRRLRLTVDSYHLLAPGVCHARKNARFCYCGVVLVFQNTRDWNAFVPKAAQQQATGIVVADDSYGKNINPEVCKIVCRVSAAAGNDGALAVTQNQDGRLPRDARDFAEDKFVCNHVTEDGDGESWKRFDDLAKMISVLRCSRH